MSVCFRIVTTLLNKLTSKIPTSLFPSALAYTSEQSLRHQYHPDLRKRKTVFFLHCQQHICLTTFCFLHTVGIKRYKALKDHYFHNGLIARVHGNTGKPRANAFDPFVVTRVTNFIIFQKAQSHTSTVYGQFP